MYIAIENNDEYDQISTPKKLSKVTFIPVKEMMDLHFKMNA